MADATDLPEEFHDEVEAGPGELQYAQVPAWVIFRFSPSAQTCYSLLKLCVKPGTKSAAPTQDQLARACGLSRRDKVKPYLDELAGGGAIAMRTVRRGMKRRTLYTVNWLPPKGFDGPLTKREWIAREWPDEGEK
jgi:hypothetical protein